MLYGLAPVDVVEVCGLPDWSGLRFSRRYSLRHPWNSAIRAEDGMMTMMSKS